MNIHVWDNQDTSLNTDLRNEKKSGKSHLTVTYWNTHRLSDKTIDQPVLPYTFNKDVPLIGMIPVMK